MLRPLARRRALLLLLLPGAAPSQLPHRRVERRTRAQRVDDVACKVKGSDIGDVGAARMMNVQRK